MAKDLKQLFADLAPARTPHVLTAIGALKSGECVLLESTGFHMVREWPPPVITYPAGQVACDHDPFVMLSEHESVVALI